MTPKRQSLAWDNLQELLDSAGNSARKGLQQFFTPADQAKTLASLLPESRAMIADLQCGSGTLLAGAANHSTEDLIGLDIDSAASIPSTRKGAHRHILHGDLQAVFPMLAEVEWKADLLVLNPPFSLQWRTESLHALSDSDCPAISEAWGKLGRKAHIDSVLATFLVALDRLTDRGEGFLICAQSSAERLFPVDSPLRSHIWLWLTCPNFFPDTNPEMDIAVLYFAKEIQSETHMLAVPRLSPAALRKIDRSTWREGLEVSSRYYSHRLTVERFSVVSGEWKELRAARRSHPFNIWLDPDGTIQRHLTPFQAASGKVPRDLVSELHKIQGQRPMSLVVQKSTRCALLRAVRSDVWRVDPSLLEAVEAAVRSYDSVRAPFYPLNEVQRLGYLDEHDHILCRASFPGFHAGKKYSLSSRTVPIRRFEHRKNLLGENEIVMIEGNELLIEISSDDHRRHSFTFDPKNENISAPVHDLQTLIGHFHIPDVPDIAALHPERYAALLESIDSLQSSFPLMSTPAR